MRIVCLLFAASFMLSGCFSMSEDIGPYGPFSPDKRAKMLKEGFNLKVTHSRWQFKPDLDEMFAVCRNSIHVYAAQVSQAEGKEIQPIDNDKIDLGYDRDHGSGVSTCTATYPVAYKQ